MSYFEPCVETVQMWIDNFKRTEGLIALRAETDDVRGTISNERLWLKGSDTQEQIDMHEQNIADLEAYLEWLENEEIEVKNRMMEYKDYISEDGTYLIPVSWEVYSTIRIKADNLEDARQKAIEHIDDIPCGTNTEYIDGTYEIQNENLIMAQGFYDMSDKVLEFN